MICPKCGANSIDGSSFCIKCGANFKELQAASAVQPVQEPVMPEPLQPMPQTNDVQPTPQPVAQEPVQPVDEVQPTPQPVAQTVAQPVVQAPVQQTSGGALNYLMFIVAILLKPFKSFKEEERKLSDTKTPFILTLIIAGAMMVANLIKTIISTVHVASYDWTKGYVYKWEWSNIKNIKWLEVIGKNFLIYAGIILAIAAVYFLASLVIKKDLKFTKSLAISATSVIPGVIGMMILSPLLGKIWAPLGILFTVVGAVYSVIILYELMNNELQLDVNTKIYFNLVCLGILAFAGYYLYVRLLVSSVTSDLGSLMDLFS